VNEIDRAIDYICELEKQESKKAGFTYGGTKSMREAEENQTRLQTALTALREKAERERGCGACVDNGAYLDCGFKRQVSEYEYEMRGITPKACPNCGRKLDSTLQRQEDKEGNEK